MARRDRYGQGEDAGKIIEFILRRKNAYYEANVTARWKDATEAIRCGIEQKFTPEEEDLTRAKYFLSTMLNADNGMNEVYTDAYGMAQKLMVLNTKRVGTARLAERGEALMENIWEEAEGLKSWLALMKDVNVYGNGVAYQKWDVRQGNTIGLQRTAGPWGILATVAMQNRTLWNRPYCLRVHPLDWFGYWRQADNLPWEGIMWEWDASHLLEMLEDEDGGYEERGLTLALEELKKGSGAKDPYYHGVEEDEDESDVPDCNTVQGYEYYGDLYGCPGHEKDRREYKVIITDRQILKKEVNELAGYRPIKRPKGRLVNDWCGGRPLLLPQVPALKMQNFFANSMIDDVADRLYAGWATWEHALQNPDDFLNPVGIGVPVRMNKDATVNQVPVRLGGGQSGIQSDVQRIYETIIEKDRQAGNFSDVMSMKGGLQDGTARAANLVASQGARQMKAVMICANETGLVPINEQLLLLKVIHVGPDELAKQTRDGKPFELTYEDMELLMERNLWTFDDSFRRDPYLDVGNMERFAKAGGVQFMSQHAADPLIPVEFWREFSRMLNMRNYDRYLPLEIPKPPAPAGAPAALPTGGPPMPVPGAEVPEGAMAESV